MTAPLCAMWQGRCGQPAHLIVDAEVPIGDTWEPLSWLICDAAPCWEAARVHGRDVGLRYLGSRRLTTADVAEMTGLVTA